MEGKGIHMDNKKGRSALILGATGLVGAHCLDHLLVDPDYDSVHVIGRRPTGRKSTRLKEHVGDLSGMESYSRFFAVDVVFCCLGTTIRKAGSRDAFRKVDLVFPETAARLADEMGAEQYVLVSSVGADPSSKVFYSRVKGEVEQAVSRYGFRKVVIARPSLLLGDRNERRIGEMVASAVLWPMSPLMVGRLARYRPVQARAVARALIAAAREMPPGRHVLESDVLRRLGT
jgi:uncharacterized protein YbjT (DUF2867 family)